MKRFVGLLLLLCLIAFLGWQVQRRVTVVRAKAARGGGRPGGAAVAVEVAPLTRGSIRDVRTFTGSLRANSQFVVAPKVAGRLDSLTVNIGDPVRRGQLIGTLESEEYVQRVEQARAELLVSRANVEQSLSSLEVARREYERAQALRQKQVASESELDAAEAHFKVCQANHKVALAQVTQKEAALKAAEVQLSYTQIQAAWEGGSDTRIVAERFVDAGAMLRANDPVVSIVEIETLTALIYVIERDYGKVKLGQPTRIDTDAIPGREFDGNVIRIAPLLKETSRQARVEIEVPNRKQELKPGMFIRARIEFEQRDDVLISPFTAITRRNGMDGVFLVDLESRKARFIPLKLGIVNAAQVEILEPALTGQVVTLGQHLLGDSSTVALPGDGAAGGAAGKKPGLVGAAGPAAAGSGKDTQTGAPPAAATGQPATKRPDAGGRS